MIEVDGLVAAVIPTPNASPSADAPAQFAAAMAVVEGETGQGGADPGSDQPLAVDPNEAESPEDVEQQPAPSASVNAEPLLDVALPVDDSHAAADPELPEQQSIDGRELDFSALVGMAPVPVEEVASPAPVAVLVPLEATDQGLVETPDLSASVMVEEFETSTTTSGSYPSISPAEVAAPAESEASAAIAGLLVATDATSDPTPVVDMAGADDAVVELSPSKRADASGTPATPTITRPESPVVPIDDEASATGAEAPEEQVAASRRPVVAGAAPSVPAPSSGESLDLAGPEVAATRLETQAPPATASTVESLVDGAAPAAPPTVESSTPSVQPGAVTAPVARADVPVSEVADVAAPPPTQTTEATPTQQVAEALREVRRLADGSHRLSLQLHPEELGAVQLEIAIRDGQLHVRAVAETEAARSALEQNLPELRSDLRDAGVRAGSLEVGPDASGRDRPDSPNRDMSGRGTGDAEEPPITPPEPSTTSGLDIRL